MQYETLAELGPISYGDPLEEARRCRRDCALFDFSFMSRARLTGEGALGCLCEIQARDLSSMRIGDIRYCLYTDAEAAVTSDLTVWKFAEDSFEIYCGRQPDMDKIAAHARTLCEFEDLSDATSVFSIQGPGSLERLSRVGDTETLSSLSYFQHENTVLGGIHCQIGRLGYTGEKGFEIITDDRSGGARLWNMLAGICQPAGVGAIDILRIEAGFILFLNECRIRANAIELGLGRFSGGQSPRCRYHLVCFRAAENVLDSPWSPPASLPEPGEGEITVSSASLSTLCNGILGLGFVRNAGRPGTVYEDPSGHFHDVRLVDLPFYDTRKSLPRSSWN